MRECTKRILELSEDRQKLKAERAEAKDLRWRITGEGQDGSRHRGTKRRYVVDEEAYYAQGSAHGGGKDGKAESGQQASAGKKTPYDAPPQPANLARKLGLEDDESDSPKKPADGKPKKKSKEELEKEKEIDEVRQIIEADSALGRYIKEVDLLGVDVLPAPKQAAQGGKQTAQPGSNNY